MENSREKGRGREEKKEEEEREWGEGAKKKKKRWREREWREEEEEERGSRMSRPRLEGKVALVTGAASGIGEEAVRLFAEKGALVVAANVQEELGRQVVSSIGSEKVCYRHCDVRDEKQVEETVVRLGQVRQPGCSVQQCRDHRPGVRNPGARFASL